MTTSLTNAVAQLRQFDQAAATLEELLLAKSLLSPICASVAAPSWATGKIKSINERIALAEASAKSALVDELTRQYDKTLPISVQNDRKREALVKQLAALGVTVNDDTGPK